MKKQKSLIKSISYFLFFAVFLSPTSLQAYEPPKSPDLFEKDEPYKNLTVRNSSGFIADLTLGMGASMDFRRNTAFSYTGALGLGYRFAITTWNLWDVAIELAFSHGGVSNRDITYIVSPAFRLGYGVPVNRAMNFFTYVGFGGALASGAKETARFSPSGFLGFQMEFIVSKYFNVLIGPRFGLKTAYQGSNLNSIDTFFVPELNAGARFKI